MKAEIPITWFDSIDSTNSEARRQLPVNAKMSVYAAKFQTAGRGQRGNKWSSAAGQNLTFSVLLNFAHPQMPDLAVRDQFLLSIVASLSVSDLLRKLNIRNSIKWPNDIYIGRRKVCGMLIENIVGNAGLEHSIIGIGLNLNQTEFPPELVNPTSVLVSSGLKTVPEDVLDDFLDIFSGYMSYLSDIEGTNEIRNKYVSRLFGLGVSREYHDCLRNIDFTGTIKGISEEGLLLMEMPDKTVTNYSFKEVSYII